jgi:hypothetical protein
VLDMRDGIGAPDGPAPGWKRSWVRDPRAAALERTATILERSAAKTDRLLPARMVEREAERLLAEHHPERHLHAADRRRRNAASLCRPLTSS